MRWLFWNVAFGDLDLERDADHIIPKVLEHGRLEDVRWLLAAYAPERIHRFLRDTGHPELSRRTLLFWRAYFGAEADEIWVDRAAARRSNDALWPD